jgi:hypothetical protein
MDLSSDVEAGYNTFSQQYSNSQRFEKWMNRISGLLGFYQFCFTVIGIAILGREWHSDVCGSSLYDYSLLVAIIVTSIILFFKYCNVAPELSGDAWIKLYIASSIVFILFLIYALIVINSKCDGISLNAIIIMIISYYSAHLLFCFGALIIGYCYACYT